MNSSEDHKLPARVRNKLEAEDLLDKHRLLLTIQQEGAQFLRERIYDIGPVAERQIFRWLGVSKEDFPDRGPIVAKRLRIANCKSFLEANGFTVRRS